MARREGVALAEFPTTREAAFGYRVVETRTRLRPEFADLPRAEIEAELRRLAVPVEKTGGPAEHEAFALLVRHVEGAG